MRSESNDNLHGCCLQSLVNDVHTNLEIVFNLFTFSNKQVQTQNYYVVQGLVNPVPVRSNSNVGNWYLFEALATAFTAKLDSPRIR